MRKKLKVLVVDDNECLCKNLLDILAFKGFDAIDVYDGYKAIEIVKKNELDVVVMDVKMPGINGVETLGILKKIAPKLEVILITAFADDEVCKIGLEDSNYTIIQKPIDIDKLIAMLEVVNKKNNIS
ncbi:MAG: response regulator [Candidatus Omnitrophica bacterium]|nr:response regulator [Candidatus Omnitrophota bacterium]